ncbi:MAG: hypothetical protein LBE75_03780 [Burkholderiales bacterium]|jgi:hypothetical protein|nr:hypothetical protein [Burkholderiales bacterium]
MTWMNWLRSEFLFCSISSNLVAERTIVHDLDMKQAIDIHCTWVNCLHDLVCLRVDRLLDFPHENATPPFILQQWLYGTARRRYGELSEYRVLRAAHEKFHSCSDGILRSHLRGRKDHARRLLNDELPIHSESVQAGIVRLYAAVAAQKH